MSDREVYTGVMSIKDGRGASKPQNVVYFNKFSPNLGNGFTAEQRGDMMSKAIKFAKDNKLELNIHGKQIGLGNYHTPAAVEKLLKTHNVETYQGFRGSVYLAFTGDTVSTGPKKVRTTELKPGAIKF
jgi:hypothetical protein